WPVHHAQPIGIRQRTEGDRHGRADGGGDTPVGPVTLSHLGSLVEIGLGRRPPGRRVCHGGAVTRMYGRLGMCGRAEREHQNNRQATYKRAHGAVLSFRTSWFRISESTSKCDTRPESKTSY